MIMNQSERLSVFDLLILVAAIAAGFAMTRSLPGYIEWYDDIQIFNKITVNSPSSISTGGWSFRVKGGRFGPIRLPSDRRPSYWLGHLPYWMGPCLGSLTVASTALALRGPRPRLYRLARRPGMAVSVAMSLSVVVKVIECLQCAASTKAPLSSIVERWESYWVFVGISLPPLIGYTLTALWLALALSGRWMAELNPGGRLCRGLGWCWIAMALISQLGTWCFALKY
jgi:hypothetical protein